MTSHRGNNSLFHSSQQLPSLGQGPSTLKSMSHKETVQCGKPGAEVMGQREEQKIDEMKNLDHFFHRYKNQEGVGLHGNPVHPPAIQYISSPGVPLNNKLVLSLPPSIQNFVLFSYTPNCRITCGKPL